MENLKNYFESNQGLGILSTADKDGKVNAAIYARPHFLSENQASFIMSSRLTYHNLKTNPYAFYLFRRDGKDYQGKRIALKKISESDDKDLINKLRRKRYSPEEEVKISELHLVTFQVDEIRPLLSNEVKADKERKPNI